MAKHTLRYNITVPFEIEVDAEDADDALQLFNETITKEDVLKQFADTFPKDLSFAEVERDAVFDEKGEYLWDYYA